MSCKGSQKIDDYILYDQEYSIDKNPSKLFITNDAPLFIPLPVSTYLAESEYASGMINDNTAEAEWYAGERVARVSWNEDTGVLTSFQVYSLDILIYEAVLQSSIPAYPLPLLGCISAFSAIGIAYLLNKQNR